jgi:hypothetical protein
MLAAEQYFTVLRSIGARYDDQGGEVNNIAPHSQPTTPPEAWRGRKLGLFLAILAVILIVVTACDQQSSGSSGSDAEAKAKIFPITSRPR